MGTSIGSGSQYALDYLNRTLEDKGPISLTRDSALNREDAIELAWNSIDAASRDIYTKGADLLYICSGGIRHYQELIKDHLDKAYQE